MTNVSFHKAYNLSFMIKITMLILHILIIRQLYLRKYSKEAQTVATKTPTEEINTQETTNGMLYQITTTVTKLSTFTFSSNIYNYFYPSNYP